MGEGECMNTRERYRAVMGFRPGVRTLLWELGYWAGATDRWYEEGLRRGPYAPPTGLPTGSGVIGEALPFPLRPGLVRYRDVDVHSVLGLDDGCVRIPIDWRANPAFEERIIEEDETTSLMINTQGVKVRVRKDRQSLPQCLDWPVRDHSSWLQVKEERYSLDISERLPVGWDWLPTSYGQRDYPLGIIVDGFFGLPRELMGVEKQLMTYYDDPGLMHEINAHLCELWLKMLEEVTSKVDLDFVHIWEDMAFRNGPLISPAMFDEFLLPYYRRIVGMLRQRGVDVILVDTDGDCWKLIPGLLKAGVTGLYPFEGRAGMDIAEVRQYFPNLQITGGIDKTVLVAGKEAIDAELEHKLPPLLQTGGFIPHVDHLVPPNVPWENFRYYREKTRQYVERYHCQ